MDVIEKFIADHANIREQDDFVKKLVASIDKDAFFWDNAVSVERFFNREIQEHMELEEHVLFPVVKKSLAQGSALIAELEKDHERLRDALKEFKKIAPHHDRFPSRSTRECLVKACKKVLDAVIPHADKEDNELFPLIKQHFTDKDYKELETLYFKFPNI